MNITPRPFVYLVDSPSNIDLYNGYSIGMALRDSLNAIKIPCVYRLVTDKHTFDLAMGQGLLESINQFQLPDLPNTHSYPFMHFCMHGNQDGVGLTNRDFIAWEDFRKSLLNHNFYKGYQPYVCMASCHGFEGVQMVDISDSVFNLLIGNSGEVMQSDLTVAYLSFYNHFFYKYATFEQAVTAMRNASGDYNFFCTIGEDVKNYKISLQNNQPCINKA